jgi:hypothetical protein
MWLTDSAWPAMTILCGLAVASAWWWMRTRKISALIVTLLCVMGIPGSYIAERLVITDRERIEAAVHEMAAAFERRQINDLLRYISPRQQALIDLVEWGFETVTKVDSLHITDVAVETFADGSRARSHFRANGRFHAEGFGDVGHKATRWELTWQREGDQWKIVDIRRLNPITGEEMDARAKRE